MFYLHSSIKNAVSLKPLFNSQFDCFFFCRAPLSFLEMGSTKKPTKKPASKSNGVINQASPNSGHARKKPSAASSTSTKKKPASISDSSSSCPLKYPTWREAIDDNVQPCAFASAVAKHYAEVGLSMTALNVQSLMEEAEDASSFLQFSATSCNPKTYLLQYLANQFQCSFGRRSCQWLAELRSIYDRC